MRRAIQLIARHLHIGGWQTLLFIVWMVVVYAFFFLQFLAYAAEFKSYFYSLLNALR